MDPQFLDSDSDCETEMAATSAQPVNEPSSHVCDHGTLDDERRAVVGEKREREAEPCSCHPDQVVRGNCSTCVQRRSTCVQRSSTCSQMGSSLLRGRAGTFIWTDVWPCLVTVGWFISCARLTSSTDHWGCMQGPQHLPCLLLLLNFCVGACLHVTRSDIRLRRGVACPQCNSAHKA